MYVYMLSGMRTLVHVYVYVYRSILPDNEFHIFTKTHISAVPGARALFLTRDPVPEARGAAGAVWSSLSLLHGNIGKWSSQDSLKARK